MVIENLSELENLQPEQLNEQLEALEVIARGREDPVMFAKEVLGFDLYDEQKIWLWATTKTQKEKCRELLIARGTFFTTPENFDRDIDELYRGVSKHILAVANQIGKTFLTAIKHIWCCYYKIGLNVSPEHHGTAEYKTLNISPHSDQANKCFDYVEKMTRGEVVFYDPDTGRSKVNKIHPVIEGFLQGTNNTLGEHTFANGSIFMSKSSGQDKATARAGEQFGFISFDECAQSHHLSIEITMLLSRLIRYGFCFDLISSPEVEKPSHQTYHRLVKEGRKLKNKWFALSDISFVQNIFISPEQKEKGMENIKSTDIAKYKQMIEGKFVSTGSRFLSLEAITQMFEKGSAAGLRRLDMGIPGRKYAVIADWGMADSGDPSWFFVLDWTDFITDNIIDVVSHEKVVGGSPTMQLATLRVLFQSFGGHGSADSEGNIIWHPVKFITDSNSLGGIIIKKMLLDLKPHDFTSHGGEKDQMLSALYNALNFGRDFYVDPVSAETIEKNPDFGKLRCYFIEELEEQLGTYKLEDAKLEQDAVMSLGMGVWFLEKKIPKNVSGRINLNPLNSYNNSIKRR